MKLSIVCSRFPYPIEKGDKLRLYHQIIELSEIYDIQLLSLSFDKVSQEAKEEVKKYCSEIEVFKLQKWKQALNLLNEIPGILPFQVAYFYNPFIKRRLQAAILQFKPDIIYSQLVRTAEYVKAMPHPKVLDYMDAFSLNYARRKEQRSGFMKFIYGLETRRLKRYEKHVFYDFDGRTIISEQDREAIDVTEKSKIEIVQNGVDASYFTPDKTQRTDNTLLFVGNMGYEPNAIAARYIINEIYPIVQKQYPDVELVIAGARPSKSLLNTRSDKIHITGWVDDIRDAYNRGAIFIAPLFSGSGLQNKILEAMAMELPIITSTMVNDSIGMNKANFIEANSLNEFTSGIFNLLENKNRRLKLGKQGRAFVLKNFSWTATTHTLKALLSQVESGNQKVKE